jgi:hypothetical protein
MPWSKAITNIPYDNIRATLVQRCKNIIATPLPESDPQSRQLSSQLAAQPTFQVQSILFEHPIMTRTEISGRALILVPTRPSSATTKSATDPVNGSADPPPGTEPCLSSTVDELRKTLAKLRRLSPTHVDGACGNLDAALHGLVWACSNVNAVLLDIDVEISGMRQPSIANVSEQLTNFDRLPSF